MSRDRYDLLMLCDLYVPGMNGFEVLRRIRQPHSGVRGDRNTPPDGRGIIVLPARPTRERASASRPRLGADACLQKPFELGDVLAPGAVTPLLRLRAATAAPRLCRGAVRRVAPARRRVQHAGPIISATRVHSVAKPSAVASPVQTVASKVSA